MAIKRTEILHPEHHAREVIFTDHFGHSHRVLVPTHLAIEDELKPFPLGPVVIKEFDDQLENIQKMMHDREQAFLAYCLAHPQHAQHELVVSHPDRKKDLVDVVGKVDGVGTKGCGCG